MYTHIQISKTFKYLLEQNTNMSKKVFTDTKEESQFK